MQVLPMPLVTAAMQQRGHDEQTIRNVLGENVLRVLREVGAVLVRDEGRQRLYRLNAMALQPIGDWLKPYERFCTERFEALDAVLDDLKGDPE